MILKLSFFGAQNIITKQMYETLAFSITYFPSLLLQLPFSFSLQLVRALELRCVQDNSGLVTMGFLKKKEDTSSPWALGWEGHPNRMWLG